MINSSWKLLGIVALCAFVGCGSDTSVSLPENATAEPPSLEVSQGGKGESKGGEVQKMKPRN
jgi:hypothetical protein